MGVREAKSQKAQRLVKSSLLFACRYGVASCEPPAYEVRG